MHKRITAVFILLFLVFSGAARADEAEDLERQIFMDKKKLVVLKNNSFTDEEAEKFWPLYEKYQNRLFGIKKQNKEFLDAYASVYKNMTDIAALMLIDDYNEMIEEQQAIMKEYSDELTRILPGQKVFRYLQVEQGLEALSRYEMTKAVPLARVM